DGIRTDGAGHLVYTSLDGLIGAIDIPSILDGSVDPGDFRVLYSSVAAGSDYAFDDLTPLVVPEPSALVLAAAALALLAFAAATRRLAQTLIQVPQTPD